MKQLTIRANIVLHLILLKSSMAYLSRYGILSIKLHAAFIASLIGSKITRRRQNIANLASMKSKTFSICLL